MQRDDLQVAVREQFELHLSEPLENAASLRTTLVKYLEHLEAAFDGDAIFNLELAQSIGRGCGALLNGFDKRTEGEQHLIQAALVYFVEADDDEGDLDSVMGFDDDAQVFNVVATELGRHDLAVEVL